MVSANGIEPGRGALWSYPPDFFWLPGAWIRSNLGRPVGVIEEEQQLFTRYAAAQHQMMCISNKWYATIIDTENGPDWVF